MVGRQILVILVLMARAARDVFKEIGNLAPENRKKSLVAEVTAGSLKSQGVWDPPPL